MPFFELDSQVKLLFLLNTSSGKSRKGHDTFNVDNGIITGACKPQLPRDKLTSDSVCRRMHNTSKPGTGMQVQQLHSRVRWGMGM